MTGSADAPEDVKSEERFGYVITQTDKDTFVIQGSAVQDVDSTCNVACVIMRSMSGYVLGKQGVDSNATYTWDVTGIAIAVTSTITVKDEWKLYNNRPNVGNTADPQKDVDVLVEKTVTIEAPIPTTPIGGKP